MKFDHSIAKVPEAAHVVFLLQGVEIGLILGSTGTGMGGGGVRLKVGFQPLKIISSAASWIRWCM